MNVQVLSDQVLLNHYLSGDRSAISKLIERHSRRVKDYIHMMVKDRDVADDIFQETFIKAVRVIDEGRYTDNGKFLSWILRIVTADPEVCQPHNLRTRRIGAAIAVEVHVRMDGAMTVARSHALTVDIERRLRARFGEGTMIAIHVEPLK